MSSYSSTLASEQFLHNAVPTLKPYEAILDAWLQQQKLRASDDAALALRAIETQELFRPGYTSFDLYCIVRLGIRATDAREITKAAELHRYCAITRLSFEKRTALACALSARQPEDELVKFHAEQYGLLEQEVKRIDEEWEKDPGKYRNSSEFSDMRWCGESVYITPVLLIDNFGMSEDEAMMVSLALLKLCRERWTEADVRLERLEDWPVMKDSHELPVIDIARVEEIPDADRAPDRDALKEEVWKDLLDAARKLAGVDCCGSRQLSDAVMEPAGASDDAPGMKDVTA